MCTNAHTFAAEVLLEQNSLLGALLVDDRHSGALALGRREATQGVLSGRRKKNKQQKKRAHYAAKQCL